MKLSNSLIQAQNQATSSQTHSHQYPSSSNPHKNLVAHQHKQSREEYHLASEPTNQSIDNLRRQLKTGGQGHGSQSPITSKSHTTINQSDLASIQSFREKQQIQQQQQFLLNQNTKLTPPRNFVQPLTHNLKTIPSPKNQVTSGPSSQKVRVVSSQNIQKNPQSTSSIVMGSPLKKMNTDPPKQKVIGKNLNSQTKVNEIINGQSSTQSQYMEQLQQQKYIQQIQQISSYASNQNQSQQQLNVNSPYNQQVQNTQQKSNSLVKLSGIPSAAVLKEFLENANKQKGSPNLNQVKTLQTSHGGGSVTTKGNHQNNTSAIGLNNQNKSKSPSTLKVQQIPLKNSASSLLKRNQNSGKSNSTNVNSQKYQIVIDTNEINNNSSTLHTNPHQTSQLQNYNVGLLSQKNLKKSLTNILSPTSTSNVGMLSVKNRTSTNQSLSNQNLISNLRSSKTDNSFNLSESSRYQKLQCQSMIISNDKATEKEGHFKNNQLHLSQPDLDTLDSEAIAHYTDLISKQALDLQEDPQQKLFKKGSNSSQSKSHKQLETMSKTNQSINKSTLNTQQSFEDKKKSQSQEFKSSRQLKSPLPFTNEKVQRSQESLKQQISGENIKDIKDFNLQCNEEEEELSIQTNSGQSFFLQKSSKQQHQKQEEPQQHISCILQSFTESLRSSQDTRRNPLDTENNFHNSNARAESNSLGDNCVNHHSKKGKYYIESESQGIFIQNPKSFCSKCAIELAGQGIKVIENEQVTKKNVIDRFLNNLRTNISEELNETLKAIEEREINLNKFYKTQESSINSFYDDCVSLLNSWRSEDLKRIFQSHQKIQEDYNERRNNIRSHIIDVENMNRDISQNIEQIIHNIKLGPFREIITQYSEKCNEFVDYCEQSNKIIPILQEFNSSNRQEYIQNLTDVFNNVRTRLFFEIENSLDCAFGNEPTFASNINHDKNNTQQINESAKKSLKKQDVSQLKNQLYISFENRELFFQAAKIASAKKQNHQGDDNAKQEGLNQGYNAHGIASELQFQNQDNELNQMTGPFSFQNISLKSQFINQQNLNNQEQIQKMQTSDNIIPINECYESDTVPNPTFGNREINSIGQQQYDNHSKPNNIQDQTLQNIRNQVINHKMMHKNNFYSLSEARLNQIQANFMENKQVDTFNLPHFQINPTQLSSHIEESIQMKGNSYSENHQNNFGQNNHSQQTVKNQGHKVSQSSGNVLFQMNKQNNQEVYTNTSYLQQIYEDEDQKMINNSESTYNSASKNVKMNSNSNQASGSTVISTSKKSQNQKQLYNQGYLKTDPVLTFSNRDTVNVNSFVDNYNLISDERKYDNQSHSSSSQIPSTSNFFTGQSTSTHKQENQKNQSQSSSSKQQLNMFILPQSNSENPMNVMINHQLSIPHSEQHYPAQSNFSHSKSTDKQPKQSQFRSQKNLSGCKPLTLLPSFMNEEDDANRYDDSNRAEAASNDRNKDTFRSCNNKLSETADDVVANKYIAYTDIQLDSLRGGQQQSLQQDNFDTKRSPSALKQIHSIGNQSVSSNSKKPPAPSPSQKLIQHKASPSITNPLDQQNSTQRECSSFQGDLGERMNSTSMSTGKKKKQYDLRLNLSSITNTPQSSQQCNNVNQTNQYAQQDFSNFVQTQSDNQQNGKQRRINSKSQAHLNANFNNQLDCNLPTPQEYNFEDLQLQSQQNNYQNQQISQKQYLSQQEMLFNQKQGQNLFQNNQKTKRGLFFDQQQQQQEEVNVTSSQQANQSLQFSETIEKNDIEQHYNCLLQAQDNTEIEQDINDSQSESILGQATKYTSNRAFNQVQYQPHNQFIPQEQVDATFQESFERNLSVAQIQPTENEQQRFITSPFQKQEQSFVDSINSQNQNLAIKSQFFYSPQFKEESPNILD